MPAPVLNTKRGIQLEIRGTPHFLIENEESDDKKHFRDIKVNDAIYGHGELNFFFNSIQLQIAKKKKKKKKKKKSKANNTLSR